MKFSVYISPQARRDIDRNSVWWAEHHSAEQALRWSNAVYEQIETLAEFPESNCLSAENYLFPYEIRDKLLGLGARPSYRAIFTIMDDSVYVLTVCRGVQDVVRPADVESPPFP